MFLIDRSLADDVEKADGLQKARFAQRDHGPGAADYLMDQLAHAQHRRTRRTIRLALGQLRKQ